MSTVTSNLSHVTAEGAQPRDVPVMAVVNLDGSAVGGGGDGGGSVEVTNFPASQAVTGPLTDAQMRATAVPVSGPLTNAQLVAISGAASAAAYADDTGAAAGTIVALLKGIYVQNATMIGLLNDIKTNTTPTP